MTATRSDFAMPLRWGESVSGPAAFSSEGGAWSGALVRSWRGTAPEMDMPPLDHHVVILHGGGAKTMTRRRDGRSLSVNAAPDAVSVVPAGAGHTWSTRGPIDFTHVYLPPALLERAVIEAFDRNPGLVHLVDDIGRPEPLLAGLLDALRRELQSGVVEGALYLDTLLNALCLELLRRCSNLSDVSGRPRHAMAPRRLRRVLDYVESYLAEPITLDDLAGAAGMSRFHFGRVFRQEMGISPYAHLLQRRVAVASIMLRDTETPLDQVAERAGLGGARRFATTFRRVTGVTPGQYRRDRQ